MILHLSILAIFLAKALHIINKEHRQGWNIKKLYNVLVVTNAALQCIDCTQQLTWALPLNNTEPAEWCPSPSGLQWTGDRCMCAVLYYPRPPVYPSPVGSRLGQQWVPVAPAVCWPTPPSHIIRATRRAIMHRPPWWRGEQICLLESGLTVHFETSALWRRSPWRFQRRTSARPERCAIGRNSVVQALYVADSGYFAGVDLRLFLLV